MMRRFSDQPQTLSDVLTGLAKRVRKVDLLVIDEIRSLWPTIVGEALADRCRPELVKSGVLIIAVPSGAFAERLLQDQETILTGFASLGERAPKSIRPLVQPS
jgi:predicted nucleic acid-binding Zn ribbon protein